MIEQIFVQRLNNKVFRKADFLQELYNSLFLQGLFHILKLSLFMFVAFERVTVAEPLVLDNILGGDPALLINDLKLVQPHTNTY
jgi:hypothetical protein